MFGDSSTFDLRKRQPSWIKKTNTFSINYNQNLMLGIPQLPKQSALVIIIYNKNHYG